MTSTTIPRPIVPDKVLESHVCRLCDKYLTVSPISTHPDGGNVCGRCRKATVTSPLFECDSLLDLTETPIPYAIFAYSNHLFPCINRYEGCTRLLAFHEIGTHENKCKSRKVTCNKCNYEGTGSQQLCHFKKQHPFNFFEKTHFWFPLEKRFKTNLLKKGDLLFFLDVDFDNSCKVRSIEFDMRPTCQQLEEDIDFFCLLKCVDGEVIDQKTLTKRRADGFYHKIQVKEEELFEDEDYVICECLLRRA